MGGYKARRQIRAKKPKKDFWLFMEGLLRELPSTEEYHVILDNHAIYKRHEVWLLGTLAMPYPHLEHENVFFHYTPTYSSWMNMVEIWLGILTRKSLRGASFATTEALCGHIRKYIEACYPTLTLSLSKKRYNIIDFITYAELWST
ncbi:MAG: transposase [Holophagales bacterium]|jgi:transposase|nr:transposase [Holophagales bacterium]